MDKITHNLSLEKRFLSLIKCSLLETSSNNWSIIKDGSRVGYIQYKKISKGNKKIGIDPTYAYVGHLNTSKVDGYFNRHSGEIDHKSFTYELNVIDNDYHINRDEITIGDYPSIRIYSPKHGRLYLIIDADGLYLFTEGESGKYTVHEEFNYHNISDRFHQFQSCSYQVTYCPKRFNIYSTIRKYSRKISGTTISDIENNIDDKNKIILTTQTTECGRLTSSDSVKYNGTIKDVADFLNKEFHIFNWFKMVINEILENADISLTDILTQEIIDKLNLSALFSEDEDIDTKHYKKD